MLQSGPLARIAAIGADPGDARGAVSVMGKGEMETWYLVRRKAPSSA